MEQAVFISELEATAERHMKLAVASFQNMDAEKLSEPSLSGGWSIAQCLWHLNSYGQFYLPLIKKTLITAGAPHRVFKSGMLGSYFIGMMKDENGKKYKAAAHHQPPVKPDAYAEVAEFITQQETLLKYLRMAQDLSLEKRIPISVSKLVRLKLGDVLQFLVAHNERHISRNCEVRV